MFISDLKAQKYFNFQLTTFLCSFFNRNCFTLHHYKTLQFSFNTSYAISLSTWPSFLLIDGADSWLKKKIEKKNSSELNGQFNTANNITNNTMHKLSTSTRRYTNDTTRHTTQQTPLTFAGPTLLCTFPSHLNIAHAYACSVWVLCVHMNEFC